MKIIVFTLFLLSSINIHASQLASAKDARNLAKNVMVLVGKGQSNKGLQLFKPYLIIPESEFNVMLNNLKMQQPMIDQRFGKTVGIEYINEEKAGKSFMKITYAQKFEKHAMRWVFYFYKPRNGWVLNTFNTDDKIQLLFSK